MFEMTMGPRIADAGSPSLTPVSLQGMPPLARAPQPANAYSGVGTDTDPHAKPVEDPRTRSPIHRTTPWRTAGALPDPSRIRRRVYVPGRAGSRRGMPE